MGDFQLRHLIRLVGGFADGEFLKIDDCHEAFCFTVDRFFEELNDAKMLVLAQRASQIGRAHV